MRIHFLMEPSGPTAPVLPNNKKPRRDAGPAGVDLN